MYMKTSAVHFSYRHIVHKNLENIIIKNKNYVLCNTIILFKILKKNLYFVVQCMLRSFMELLLAKLSCEKFEFFIFKFIAYGYNSYDIHTYEIRKCTSIFNCRLTLPPFIPPLYPDLSTRLWWTFTAKSVVRLSQLLRLYSWSSTLSPGVPLIHYGVENSEHSIWRYNFWPSVVNHRWDIDYNVLIL